MDTVSITPISWSIPPKRQAAKRHYGVHPFFTRRAWNVVQEYIKNFTDQCDVVLDPFGGSGVTAVEALVLGRKAIHVDICPLANFITQQIAIAPIDINMLAEAFRSIEKQCKEHILDLYQMNDAEVATIVVPFWYPKGIRLPKNADVDFVEELFTPRSLFALSMLHHHIDQISEPDIRNLLFLAFSATLAKVNRTFVSAKGRAESRGGSTVFSIYRYYVPKNPVELNVWEQFAMRFRKIMAAKKETNQLIGANYSPENCQIYTDSATKLTQFLEPESVDYIYTDPPYGAHIAYLDLTVMWNAWLGFEVTEEQKSLEVIEGGDLGKTKSQYDDLLSVSLNEMFRVLKKDSWLSIVFAHKDPAYWDTLVGAAQRSGFEYVNTAVQPVSVIWSMHKKKNPLHVLSGELVLNFRKVATPQTIAIMTIGSDVVQIIKNSAELTIVRNNGATTEQIYEELIPRLLEAGLLGDVRDKMADITSLLEQEFEFSTLDNSWHIKPNTSIGTFIPLHERIRFYVCDYLVKCERLGRQATLEDVVFNIMPNLVNGEQPTKQTILEVLEKVAYSPDDKHWVLSQPKAQLQFDFASSIAAIPSLQVPMATIEHNEIIYRLAKMALGAGLLVHIGKKEQSQTWNKERFYDLSLKHFPYIGEVSEFTRGKIEQIDCIWFNTSAEPVYAFEVEGSTPITSGIDRFIELLKIAPNIGKNKRVILVIPLHRQKKINTILRESHYIGHPLYMETKLSYLFYSRLLDVYHDLVGKTPPVEVLINKLGAARDFPPIQR